MKRIVILIDGTWNAKGTGIDTNVAKLAPPEAHGHGVPLIVATAPDGIQQIVKYHTGVGAEADWLKHVLGGSIGIGLRDIVLDAYRTVVETYDPGDDVIICGFSRGAYAARALAGMIGKSGIQQRHDKAAAQAAWDNYRAAPGTKTGSPPTPIDRHADNRIKCVAVWDTVGSYGVPAGVGLDGLGRFYAQTFLGFHDTYFGSHIDVGLHALAVDERRRPFVPTLWTARKDNPPRGHVEQTWFAGAHSNVGGGERDPRLSDIALLWMIARLEALTGLAFDRNAVWAMTDATARDRIDGEVYDSTVGWLIDHQWPRLRTILSPDAIDHGAVVSTTNPAEENINERVHWSVLEKHGRPCTVFGQANTAYTPQNLPKDLRPEQIAALTPEEEILFRRPTPPIA